MCQCFPTLSRSNAHWTPLFVLWTLSLSISERSQTYGSHYHTDSQLVWRLNNKLIPNPLLQGYQWTGTTMETMSHIPQLSHLQLLFWFNSDWVKMEGYTYQKVISGTPGMISRHVTGAVSLGLSKHFLERMYSCSAPKLLTKQSIIQVQFCNFNFRVATKKPKRMHQKTRDV